MGLLGIELISPQLSNFLSDFQAPYTTQPPVPNMCTVDYWRHIRHQALLSRGRLPQMIIETKMFFCTNVSQILSGLSGAVNKGKTRVLPGIQAELSPLHLMLTSNSFVGQTPGVLLHWVILLSVPSQSTSLKNTVSVPPGKAENESTSGSGLINNGQNKNNSDQCSNSKFRLLIVSDSRNMFPNNFSLLRTCDNSKFHHFLKCEDNFTILHESNLLHLRTTYLNVAIIVVLENVYCWQILYYYLFEPRS